MRDDARETGVGDAASTGRAAATTSPRPPAPPVHPDAWLRRRYRAYVRAQAEALPRLLPREAIRPLYREAVQRARARGEPVGEDPMATLVACCRELLPLPSFEVWREDFLAHREAHLADPAAGSLPPPADPVLVDVRPLVADGREWTASLTVRNDPDGAWRGFVTFEGGPNGPAHNTADIFSDDDPDRIRARFADFEDRTLEAFLRSVLPG